MHKGTRRLAFFFSGTLLATFAFVAACSTDNGETPIPVVTNDSGKTKKGKDADTDGEDPDPTDDGGDTVPDAGAPDCSAAPTLRQNAAVFCFNAGQCKPGEAGICCADAKGSDGKFLPPKCAEAAEATTGYEVGSCEFAEGSGGREWHCTESAHCPNAGESCCVIGGTEGTPRAFPDSNFPGCGTYFNGDQGRNVGGSRCKTGCEAGELTLCSSDAECPTGTACHPIKLANRFTGVCQ